MGRGARPSQDEAGLRGRAGGTRDPDRRRAHLGEDPREDVDGQRDWWADSQPSGASWSFDHERIGLRKRTPNGYVLTQHKVHFAAPQPRL